MKFEPDNDGVTHINVYSKGRTELGRLLTNFARTPFQHPQYGHFESMEGYWYWVKTGKNKDQLRRFYGFYAKDIGRSIPAVHNPQFEHDIREGIRAKLECNLDLQTLLVSSGSLPLVHYYVYGGKVVVPKGHDWQMDEWMRLRTLYQEKINDR